MLELTFLQAFILAVGSLLIGMTMLIRGGGWTIDSAVYIATHLGISPLVVGFTIVAFGTSLPELLVSINANLQGAPGIAVGNVVGSNIANILLVIGATAVFSKLVIEVSRSLIRDMLIMIAITVGFILLLLSHNLGQFVGGAMVAVLAIYVFLQYMMAKKGKEPIEVLEEPGFRSISHSLAYLIGGLVFVALGSEFLVRGATVSATVIGVPDDVIGLTVIALGTSLPELSTCLAAAAKRQTDIILGNIIGSNVFNVLMIVGVTALIKPINVDMLAPLLLRLDIWIMLAVALAFCFSVLLFKRIPRAIGIGFVALYIIYSISVYVLNFGTA